MVHLTIQNAHTCEVPPVVVPEAIEALKPILGDLGGDLGDVSEQFRGIMIRTCKRPWAGAASWDISRGGVPVALCVVCRDEDARHSAWSAIERTYLGLSDKAPAWYAPGALPPQPDALPWLTTLLLMPGESMCLDMMPWLADLDQCIARAIIGMMETRP